LAGGSGEHAGGDTEGDEESFDGAAVHGQPFVGALEDRIWGPDTPQGTSLVSRPVLVCSAVDVTWPGVLGPVDCVADAQDWDGFTARGRLEAAASRRGDARGRASARGRSRVVAPTLATRTRDHGVCSKSRAWIVIARRL
jgi:hypothetical protein